MPRAPPINKSTRGRPPKSVVSRVSARPNKGVNPNRQAVQVAPKPNQHPPPPSEHSDQDHSDQESVMHHDVQPGTSSGGAANMPPNVHFTGQDLDAHINRLITQALANNASSQSPNQASSAALSPTSQSDHLLQPPSKRARGPSLLNRTSDSGHSDDSDMESADPVPAVRQSFGLLVGQNVSQSLRQKIIADKYVDMYELLPEFTKSEQHLVLTTSKNGEHLKLLKESKDVRITLDQWNQAFAHYMAIYQSTTSTYDDLNALILGMLTYQRDVNSLARKDLPWWRYDSQFRRDKSVNPSRFSFGDLRHDLIENIRYTPRTKQPFRPVQNRFTGYKNQSFRNTSLIQTESAQRIPQGFCFKFHSKNNRCTSKGQCRFTHACPNCGAKHALHLCTV